MCKKKSTKTLMFLAVSAIFLLVGCSNQSITEPPVQGLTTDQIDFVSWKAEVADVAVKTDKSIEELESLERWTIPGLDWGIVFKRFGGTVGGETTFGNKVDVPAYAFRQHFRFIVVRVVCVEDGEQCGAEVDFLPSQNFNKDVKVTLSYEYLDFDGDPSGLNIYWYDEDGDLWYLVPDPEIDTENCTVSVYVNHFTRFAWGF